MIRLFILQFIFLLCTNVLFSKVEIIDPTVEESFSFAIVVDNSTFDRIENSILEYRDAIQDKDKLSVYVLVVSDEQPNEIRTRINDLYKSSNLEGAVFIGDVPIPMIRGAQHMTSAFKMNENRDWVDSSVPSDRYYDDFDLKFKFLKRDSTNSLLYYYELTPESPQKIDKDIYSGRIKPPVTDDSKYDMIKNYLKKAVAAKNNPALLDNGFVYTGHGYHSESLISWRDEAIALREQFPLMFKIGGKLKHIRESPSSDMKEVIMIDLEKEKYDLAVFHAHGSDDAQYLMGYPAAESIQENVKSIRRFVRSKIRTAKERGRDIEELKNYYKENYNLTDKWFEGTFVDSVYKADSTFNYSMDIYSDDLALFSPKPNL
ncbi:MAG: hypothetical protein U5K00_05155 [Melioribacteraceae bacterium]|nr:hypothetical protein [Melioribacteraceae bacterium]